MTPNPARGRKLLSGVEDDGGLGRLMTPNPARGRKLRVKMGGKLFHVSGIDKVL